MVNSDGIDIDFPDDENSDLTAQLVVDDEVVCWTCGFVVERDRIKNMIDRLRDLRTEKLEERNNVNDPIDELAEQRSEIQKLPRERDRTEQRLADVKEEITATETRIKDIEAPLTEQREEVERLEAETEEAGAGENYDEVLELHRQANELELRVGQLEDELADVEADIADHEDAVDERSELTARRKELTDELTELRMKVDWIERREREVRERRRKVERTTFDFHIIRATEDGTTYRDTIDNLSKSERKVTRWCSRPPDISSTTCTRRSHSSCSTRSKLLTPTASLRLWIISVSTPTISLSPCSPRTPPHSPATITRWSQFNVAALSASKSVPVVDPFVAAWDIVALRSYYCKDNLPIGQFLGDYLTLVPYRLLDVTDRFTEHAREFRLQGVLIYSVRRTSNRDCAED
jgi:predicted  nucleic acid-binding Zn-ribbon protein